MHPLSFLLSLFASTAAALPATPATTTSPCTMAATQEASPSRPPPRPFLSTGVPRATADNGADPTPSPIYTTVRLPSPSPSNSSSSSSTTSNNTAPCPSMRRPLRLGPARLHNKPSSSDNALSPAAVVAAAAVAVETPTDGPRDYASLIPPAPGVTPRPEPNLAEMGYTQTTYYSCATRGASVHCGWHRPIMVAPANNNAVAAAPGSAGMVGTRAGIGALVAGVLGVIMAG